MIELLIRYGADIRKKSPDGWTPLLLACRANSAAAAETLVSDWALKTEEGGKSNIDEKDPKGQTALHHAIANANWDLVRTLTNKGADVNLPNAQGVLPIFPIVELGDSSLVLGLLTHGAKPNVADKSGMTPLQIAVSRKNTPVAQALFQYGAR
ncbi:MAG: ankyrin repeat domain-containing protein [Candidatus Hydrogenedentes bacterium]|nr:ankyrin repeat domain-containing protein [Candidatus Hydrogenedentota bacterium]